MRLVALMLSVLVGACTQIDPYQREGMWRPNDANETNLRAMVASPSDLVRPAPPDAASGQQAVAALDRLRRDKVRPLPDSTIARVASGGAAAPGAAN